MTTFTFSAPASKRRVAHTSELTRVAGLRRRVWAPEEAEAFADRLTQVLKTPQGQMRLRPVQAVSLYEMSELGGMFGPQRCGAGKTLLSLLSPSVMQRVKQRAFRPLLIVPAGLLEKTERDRRLLAEHWQIATFLRIMSYEWLGRVQAAEALQEYQPDFIILDEAHRVRNTKSSVCRRIRRFMQEQSRLNSAHEPVRCVAMSGTVTKRSLHDYAHIMKWCLPAAEQPLPLHFQDLMDWADALDEKKERRDGADDRIDPGELRLLCNEEEARVWDSGAKQRAARMAFRRRLVETPGVVATAESPIDATLTVRAARLAHVHDSVERAFDVLRTEWETPDGWPIWDGLAMFRHARELGLSFFYKWDPRPPAEWLEPRKAWAKFVRETIKHSRTLDSELQVRQWVEKLREGAVDRPQHMTVGGVEEALQTLDAWLAVRETFEPNTVPVWLDDGALEFVADWAGKHRGIVWVEHRCFGERLERDFGIPYYGRRGRDGRGHFIDDHPRDQSLVASIAANKEGRNLQAWSENLVVSMPANGLANEQMISRTHRDGQEADEVVVEVLVSCLEHVEAFDQARRDADYIQASTGSPQKLMLAGVDFSRQELLGAGPRWHK